jgi:hypothetical protein
MTDQDRDAAAAGTPLRYPRVYTAGDGATHFEDIEVAMAPAVYVPGIPLVDVALPHAVQALTFSRLVAGYSSDWHPAPRRQFVLTLAGAMELTVSDGEARCFGPGSVFLVEDTTGAGHQTRAVGAEPCVFVTVAYT